jgi:Zn finger protein HypA/HybF involved in hydrogenase expression
MDSQQLTVEIKQRSRCRRCGAQLTSSYDEIGCIQCGAVHTKDGKLETIKSALELITDIIIQGLD